MKINLHNYDHNYLKVHVKIKLRKVPIKMVSDRIILIKKLCYLFFAILYCLFGNATIKKVRSMFLKNSSCT